MLVFGLLVTDIVEHIVRVAGTEQIEEVQPALRGTGAEPLQNPFFPA
jgi:hypothetical protein